MSKTKSRKDGQLAERMTQIDQEGLTEAYITSADLADGLTE